MKKTCNGPIIAKNGDLNVIDCRVCKFAHLHAGGASEFDYLEDSFQNMEGVEKERWEHGLGFWRSRYAFDWKILGEPESLLDYGCGLGWFLDFTRKGIGAEISHFLREQAIPTVQHRIFKPDSPRVRDRFQAVRMSLVLEHIERPIGFLEENLKLWQPETILICVPNEFNPLQQRIGGSWFVSPWHWNYFTPESLIGLTAQFGYKPVFRGATFPMELFVLAGLDYRGNDAVGKKCHLARLRLERRAGSGIFRVYSALHRLLGWGREIVYLFKRG